MDDKLTIFIAVTSAAVVLQMLILASIYFSRCESWQRRSRQFRTKLRLRLCRSWKAARSSKLMSGACWRVRHPKWNWCSTMQRPSPRRLTELSGGVETTLNDLLDRARLQVIRADDMVTRAMDQLEETTEKVAHTVTSPVKHASGIVHGISTGVGTFFRAEEAEEAGTVRRDVYLVWIAMLVGQEAAPRRCLVVCA